MTAAHEIKPIIKEKALLTVIYREWGKACVTEVELGSEHAEMQWVHLIASGWAKLQGIEMPLQNALLDSAMHYRLWGWVCRCYSLAAVFGSLV